MEFPQDLLDLISSYNKIPMKFPTTRPIIINMPFSKKDSKIFNKLQEFFDYNAGDDWFEYLNERDFLGPNALGMSDDEFQDFIIGLTPFYTVRDFIGFKKDIKKIIKKMEKDIEKAENEDEDFENAEEEILEKARKDILFLMNASNFLKICKIAENETRVHTGDEDDDEANDDYE